MNEAVLQALVDCIAFIELSPDDVIDPDAAVRALEDVSFVLGDFPQEAGGPRKAGRAACG